MRVSRSGVVVATVYTVLAIGSVVWGYSLTEPKESTLLMQLPVVPVLALLDAAGQSRAMSPPLIYTAVHCGPP